MNERVLKILVEYNNVGIDDDDAMRPILTQLMRSYRDDSLIKTLVYQTINSMNPVVVVINLDHIRALMSEHDINITDEIWEAIRHCILCSCRCKTMIDEDEHQTKSIIDQAKEVYDDTFSRCKVTREENLIDLIKRQLALLEDMLADKQKKGN